MAETTVMNPTVNTAPNGSQTTTYAPTTNTDGVPNPPSPQNTPPPSPTSTAPIVPTAASTTPVMTPTGLSSIATPMTVPPSTQTPSTAMAGLQGSIDTTTNPNPDTDPSVLAKNTAAAQQNSNTSLQALIDELSNKTSTAAATDQADAANPDGTGSVDTLSKNVADVNNQILAEKNSLNSIIADITKNSSGLGADALAGQIKQATDQSTARQANLAVILSAAQGNYTAAKTIADAAVAASTQAEEDKITALQTIYTANKDEFTTAEQEEFQAAQTQRTSDLETARNQMTQISDLAITALKNGAPTSVATAIQNSGSLADAEKAAGGYLVTPTKTTAADTQSQALAGIGQLLTLNADGSSLKTPSGAPYVSTTGGGTYITPAGLQAILNAAVQDKVSRAQVLDQYSNYLDPHAASAYGLSAAEMKTYGVDNTVPASSSGGFLSRLGL